jgi:tetratricopeptide (TPR) repeat protein
MNQGQYERARIKFEEVLPTMKVELGNGDPRTLDTMSSCAMNYKLLDQYQNAVKLHEEAFEISSLIHGSTHPTTIVSRVNLCEGYNRIAKLGKPISFYEETTKLSAERLGPTHSITLVSKNNLANALRTAKQLKRAHSLNVEVYDEMLKALGPKHDHTLDVMGNLANTYVETGSPLKGMKMLEQCIQLKTEFFGKDHATTLMSMNNLASMYWKAHQLDKSIPLFEQTLALQTERLGPNHSHTLLTKANLGVNYCDAGKPTKGIPLLLEIHEHRKEQPDCLWAQMILLQNLKRTDKRDLHKSLVPEVVAHVRANFDSDDLELSMYLYMLGMEYSNFGDFISAKELLSDSLAIREKHKIENLETDLTRLYIGMCMLDLHQHELAEPYLLAGHKALTTTIAIEGSPENRRKLKQNLLTATHGLIEFHRRENNQAEQEEFQRQLLELQKE